MKIPQGRLFIFTFDLIPIFTHFTSVTIDGVWIGDWIYLTYDS
jgi:hypothetical protein